MKTRKRKFYQLQLFNKMAALLIFFILSLSAYSQGFVVSGTVVDKSNAGIPGATVLVKGTTNGVISDLDGKYSIRVAVKDAILQFSSVGFLSKDVPVKGQAVINVSLEEDLKQIDEIVVVGYGVQKKSDLTGSVSSVSGEQLTKLAVSGVDQALQGKAAGVNVIQNTGMPGGEISIQIRGISSINGTAPLVIVDGMPGSLSGISPDNIESIEILKDASSAAIYGSSGGNGVILVTTKKGKAGKTNVSFNYYRGYQDPWKQIDVLNSQEYAEVINYINKYKNPNSYVPLTTQPDTLPNYNWQDIMFRTAIMENCDLSISGGNENSQFLVSGNILRQDGILLNSGYKKYNFRIVSDHKLGKYFKVGEIVNYGQSHNEGYDEWVFRSEYNSPITGILKMYPYVPPYDENGKWSISPNGESNPIVALDVLDRQKNNYSVDGNAYLDITPFKGFVFTSRIKGAISFGVTDEFKKVYSYSPTVKNDHSEVDKEITQYSEWTFQNFANYNTTLGEKHNIGAMVGMEAHADKSSNMKGLRYDVLSEIDENQFFDASTDNSSVAQIVTGGGDHNSNYSYFARLNYDYASKYLLTVNFRQDVSSRFGPSNRKGNFTSFSLGWKFSEEQFMKNQDIVSFGKLRFGYGETGANAPEGFRYSPEVVQNLACLNYIFDGSTISQGAASVQIANPGMKWETMIMKNAGVDLGFFKNAFTLNIDLFEKENVDMLYYKSLLAGTGVYQNPSYLYQLGGDARPLMNLGQIRNSGMEITMGYKKSLGELKMGIDANMTFLKNKVIDIAGDTISQGTTGNSLKNICRTVEGMPMSQFWGFKTDGIFSMDDAYWETDKKGNRTPYVTNQPFSFNAKGDTVYASPRAKPGDIRFIDRNGDGKLTDEDKTFLGSPIPTFLFSVACNFEYKGFDFSMNIQSSWGNKIFNGAKAELMNQDVGGNRLATVLDQYRLPIYDSNGNLIDEGNTDATLFRLDPKGDNQNLTRVSDIFIEDGSYVRLKNIQLGYTLPTNISMKIGAQYLRIYLGAKNLLTFTKYSGFDPEMGSSNLLEQGIDHAASYPQARMILMGINLKF